MHGLGEENVAEVRFVRIGVLCGTFEMRMGPFKSNRYDRRGIVSEIKVRLGMELCGK